MTLNTHTYLFTKQLSISFVLLAIYLFMITVTISSPSYFFPLRGTTVMVGGPVVSLDTVGVLPNVGIKVGLNVTGLLVGTHTSTHSQVPAWADPTPKASSQHSAALAKNVILS